MKQCKKCGDEKPLNDFYVQKNGKDGRASACKECRKESIRVGRVKNAERYRDYKLSREVVRELLDYDPETGVFTWRVRGKRWFDTDRNHQSWNAKNAGKRAGSIKAYRKGGYLGRVIGIFGRLYNEHRIVWMWMTQDPMPEQIDHVNRNGTDNRWINLRDSSHSGNARNHSKRRDNSSGFTGVYWSKDTGKWRAGCRVDGEMNWLGLFSDIEDAGRVAAAFRAENGFDPRHGVEIAHYHKEAK